MSNPNWKKEQNKEEDEIPELKEEYIPLKESSPTVGKKHNWIQRGPEIICTSCETPHGIRVGVHKRLMGFDENNNMIIKNV